MIRHDPVLPPEDIYPIHDWRLVESRLNLKAIAQTETIFSTANGYLGIRGAFEEGSPAYAHGTFINAFYESWPILYGESAFGYARHGQTIVNVPDAPRSSVFMSTMSPSTLRVRASNATNALWTCKTAPWTARFFGKLPRADRS